MRWSLTSICQQLAVAKQLRQSDAVFFSLDCRGVQGRRKAIKIGSALLRLSSFTVQSVLATDAIAGRRVKRLITSAGSEEGI